MTSISAEQQLIAGLVPVGARVLDLGCGPGASAAVMARAGLKVTATDAVPEMVAMAKAHPGVSATVATFDEISGTDVFDGIWASQWPQDGFPKKSYRKFESSGLAGSGRSGGSGWNEVRLKPDPTVSDTTVSDTISGVPAGRVLHFASRLTPVTPISA